MTTVAKMAELLGKTDDAAAYRKAGRGHRPGRAARRSSTRKPIPTPTATSSTKRCPCWSASRPQPLRPAVLNRLEQEITVRKKGHVDTGHPRHLLPHQNRWSSQNRNDLIFQMANQKTYPGWGYMLEQGATTLWEQWDGQNSLLHSSFRLDRLLVHRGDRRHPARPGPARLPTFLDPARDCRRPDLGKRRVRFASTAKSAAIGRCRTVG